MKRTTCLILFLFAIAAYPVYGETPESSSSPVKEYLEAVKIINPDSANARLSELVKRLEKMDTQAGNDKVSSKESTEIQYLALVKMALNEIQKANSATELSLKNSREGALNHLYRAALLDPNRPEAFICLSWLKQERGEDASWYVNKAKHACKNEPNVDLLLLEGRRAEMIGNYSLAALTYAKVLQPSCKYSAEPFILTRFRSSVLMAQGQDTFDCRVPKYYWVPDVFETLNFGENTDSGKAEMSQLRDAVRKAAEKSIISTYIQDDHIYRYLLNQKLLHAVRTYPHIPGYDTGYRFSKLLDFKVPQDPVQKTKAKPRKLAAAFLAASFDMDETKLKKLESEWERIETEAKQFVASTPDPKEKAKKLFDWLKDNVLKEYHILNGFTGEQVVQSKQYYMCMTGALTYTLLARSVGLDAKGVFKPGHALAAVDCSDTRCFVETTVPKEKVNEGFIESSRSRVEEKATELSREAKKQGGVYIRSKEEIVTPSKMVARQYLNLRCGTQVTLLRNHRARVIEIIKTVPKKDKKVMEATLEELRKEKKDQSIQELNNEFIEDLVDNVWPKMAFQRYPELFAWVLQTLTSEHPECLAEYKLLMNKSGKMSRLGVHVDPSIAKDLYGQIISDLIVEFRKAQRIKESVGEQIQALPYSQKQKNAAMREVSSLLSAYLSTQIDGTVAEASDLVADLRKLDREAGRNIPNSPFRAVYGSILKLAVLTDNASVAGNIISEIVSGAEIKPGSEQERPL